MKILQVIPTVCESHGGPSIGAVELNKALRRMGHDAVILTTPAGMAEGEREAPRMAGSRIDYVNPSWPAALENSAAMGRYLLERRQQFDAVHIHGLYRLPQVYSYLGARRHRVVFGLQPHGTLEDYDRRNSARSKTIYLAAIGRRILREASYVVFTSDAEQQQAGDVVRAAQALRVNLGAFLEEPVEDQELAAAVGDTPREKTFLFLGRYARKKRPDELLRIWAASGAQDHGGRLVLAGPDQDFRRIDLQRQAHELGVARSVVVLGPVAGAAKSWLYRRCGTFVLPSENENFGVAVAEAMLAGCCCVVTPEVASGQLVQEAAAGFVVSGEEFASALARIVRDGGDVARRGRNAERFARAHLGWEAFAGALTARIESARAVS